MFGSFPIVILNYTSFFRRCNYKYTKENSVRDGDTSQCTSNPVSNKLNFCSLVPCHVTMVQIPINSYGLCVLYTFHQSEEIPLPKRRRAATPDNGPSTPNSSVMDSARVTRGSARKKLELAGPPPSNALGSSSGVKVRHYLLHLIDGYEI